MIKLSEIIARKDEICSYAKMFGFTNLRIFPSVIPEETNNLNLLIDLDPENSKADPERAAVLEYFLSDLLKCPVTVSMEHQLVTFYKNTILNNLASLEGLAQQISNVFKEDDPVFAELPQGSLNQDEDESLTMSRSIYLEQAHKIITEYQNISFSGIACFKRGL